MQHASWVAGEDIIGHAARTTGIPTLKTRKWIVSSEQQSFLYVPITFILIKIRFLSPGVNLYVISCQVYRNVPIL